MDFLRAGIKSVVGGQEVNDSQAQGIETVSVMLNEQPILSLTFSRGISELVALYIISSFAF